MRPESDHPKAAPNRTVTVPIRRAAPRRAPLALAAAVALAAALASPGGAQMGRGAPATLAETGLYADAAAGTLAAGVLPFTPQYPLWTDGAAKRRWILLPEGGEIDAADPDAWVFPVGTQLWKEFSFGGRRVETRYMALGPAGWTFATYAWSADESAAALVPERGTRAAYELAPGVFHDLPGRWDCLSCHDGNRTPVLGFAALQLSPDRDPLAPHAEPPEPGAVDLARLVELGRIRNLPERWISSAPRIAAASPLERAALGYLHGNCSGCHNSRGPLASLGLSFEVRLAPAHGPAAEALATAYARTATYRPPGGATLARIAPGDPDASLLVRRMASRQPLLQMPPLGTQRVDEQALALVTEWIRQAHQAPAEPPQPLRSTRLTATDTLDNRSSK